MFDKAKLHRIQHFYMFTSGSTRGYNQFIYLDDINDVVSIHGVPYEYGNVGDATGQQIKALGSSKDGFGQLPLIKLAQNMIDFKLQLGVAKTCDAWRSVMMGQYDMFIEDVGNLASLESLHPTVTRTQRLWVGNMEMIGSPTFFIDMFDVSLWLFFFLSFMLLGFLSTVGIKIIQRYSGTRDYSLPWFSMLTNQGGGENSTLIFPKILIIVLSILAIMFHGSFEAFLSSYLAIRKPDLPFSNLEELVKTDYTLCVPVGTTIHTYIENYLRLSSSPYKNLNDRRCPDSFMNPDLLKNIFDSICVGGKTVIFGVNVKKSTNESCPGTNLVPLNQKYFLEYHTFLVSPSFKYREQFNRGIIRIRTSGFVNRFMTYQGIDEDIKGRQSVVYDDGIPQIYFQQTQIIFLILIVGIMLAAIFFIIELLVDKRNRVVRNAD